MHKVIKKIIRCKLINYLSVYYKTYIIVNFFLNCRSPKSNYYCNILLSLANKKCVKKHILIFKRRKI